MLILMTAGCVSAPTRFYVSPENAPRVTPASMTDHLNEIMVLECPRLLGNRERVHGALTLRLDVDTAGIVRRASLRRSSSSQSFDDVLGALAARLRVPPPPRTPADAANGRRLEAFYSCTHTAADVVLRFDST